MVASGLTEAMDYDVYQASDGRFLVAVWHAAEELGQGAAVAVNLDFAARQSAVSIYDPMDGTTAVDRLTDVNKVTLDMPPGVVIVEVRP